VKMNYPWHYRKRRKETARCTSIKVTNELNERYLAQIQEAERKQQAETRGCISRFTIDSGPSERIFEQELIDDETEPPHPHSAQ
jgi:hypothetical protein